MTKHRPLLLSLFLVFRCLAIAEEAPSQKAPPSGQPTALQQENALKALAATQKEVLTFVSGFPDTSFRVYPVDRKSGRTQIDLTVRRSDYMITMSFGARFNANFTEAEDVRARSFWVILMDGSAQKLDLKFSDLTALCEDPDGFIAAKRKNG
jgi:hypothetical protein